MALSDYDTLECPRCEGATKPARENPGGSVSYRHNCGDGVIFKWIITRDGDIDKERQVLAGLEAEA